MPCRNCGWTMLSSSQDGVVPWNVLACGSFLSLFENFSHRQHSSLVPKRKRKTVFSIVRRASTRAFCIRSATKGEASVGPMESGNFKLFSNGSQLGKVLVTLEWEFSKAWTLLDKIYGKMLLMFNRRFCLEESAGRLPWYILSHHAILALTKKPTK